MNTLKKIKVEMCRAYEEAGLPCIFTPLSPFEKMEMKQINDRRMAAHTVAISRHTTERIMENMREQYRAAGTNVLKAPANGQKVQSASKIAGRSGQSVAERANRIQSNMKSMSGSTKPKTKKIMQLT